MAGIPSNSMNLNATVEGLVNWDGASVMSVTPLTQYSTLAAGSSKTVAQIAPSTAGYVLTSNGPISFPTYQALPASNASVLVQQIRNITTSTSSTATAIPFDNTKPQSGEGAQVFSQAITPTNANNVIRVTGILIGGSNGTFFNAALFKDAGADAIAAWSMYNPGTVVGPLAFEYYEVAGSTSSRTYSLRYGAEATKTAYLNQSSAGVNLGSLMTSTFVLEEILV